MLEVRQGSIEVLPLANAVYTNTHAGAQIPNIRKPIGTEWLNDWFGYGGMGWVVLDICDARLYRLRLGTAAGSSVRSNHASSAEPARTIAAVGGGGCSGTFDSRVCSGLLALGRIGSVVLQVIELGKSAV